MKAALLALWFLAVASLAPAATETQQLYLSGHGKDDAIPWRFFCTSGAQSGYWTNLPVPSNWEMHGFGTLNYHRDQTNAYGERGLYEREFTLPASWTNHRVFLVFEGAMTDTSAKLNGESVGPVHQGGFYRFRYEVTSLVKPGADNKLEVDVAKRSANASVNGAERTGDYWMFGGLYRPVHLDAVPLQGLERVAIDAKAEGTFTMEVFTEGVTDADAVEAQIQTLSGRNIGKAFSLPLNLHAAAQGAPLRMTTKIRSPKTWSAETPNLYQVEVRLKRGREVLHRMSQRFGFRTLEVRDGDGIYVNGSKVILKGVNRHSFWPDSGRCLSEAVHRFDIATIKEMNGNAVRMSHYPPDAEFLDLCDELGLYVLDELTGWHKNYDNDVGVKLVREMVIRDVNHPSILLWDNGNEGGFNTNLDGLFPQFDPQKRRVLHPWATFGGFCTAHYLAYDKAEIAASGKSVFFVPPDKEVAATNDTKKYIYLPTEFQHALFDGGGGAGLADYWSMMMSHTNCAGGFIWSFLDEAVRRPDTGQLDTAGNQAPDGLVGPYREREASFYAVKEIWATKPKPSKKVRAGDEIAVPSQPGRKPHGEAVTVTESTIAVRQQELQFTIDRTTGRLAAVRHGGRTFSFTNGPLFIPVGTNLPAAVEVADSREVRVTYTGSSNRVVWSWPGRGWLRCDYQFDCTGTNDAIGVVFDYPEVNVKSKRWLGDGPFRVWKNRVAGNTFGVWSNAYNDTITGWRGWEYPEFKGCFTNVHWLQLDTTEGVITVVPQGIPFVQVLTPGQPPTNVVAKTGVKLPACGLGLLHAIPPIGTKFKEPAGLGPNSQPNVGQGGYAGTVYLHFGKLSR